MKTDLRSAARSLWQILTEVPGWPDAPFRKRARRAWPIVVPAAATLALLTWMFALHDPALGQLRAEHAPLLQLEAEVDQLNQRYSDQQVTSLGETVESLRRQFVLNPAEANEYLAQLEREATRQGWKATLRLGEIPESVPEGQQLVHVPVRARFNPAENNPQPLVSFLTLLERIRTGSRRIELMRLNIGADEARWHTVEVGFRIPILRSHAQAPQ